MRKILVILFGIIFIGVGIFVTIQNKNQVKRCTEEVAGTVVDYHIETETDEDLNTKTTYYPIITYKAGNREIKQKSSSGFGNEKYRINESIDILYNPDNVEEFIIKGDKTGNILGIIFIIAGAVVVVAGIFKRNF